MTSSSPRPLHFPSYPSDVRDPSWVVPAKEAAERKNAEQEPIQSIAFPEYEDEEKDPGRHKRGTRGRSNPSASHASTPSKGRQSSLAIREPSLEDYRAASSMAPGGHAQHISRDAFRRTAPGYSLRPPSRGVSSWAPREDRRSMLPPPSNHVSRGPVDTTDLDAKARLFFEAAAELGTTRLRVLAEVEQELIEFSVAIAETILEEELRTSPDLHRKLVRAAVRLLQGSDEATLRTSPEAHRAICEAFGGEEFEYQEISLRVLLDPSLEGLGCMVESGASRVNGTLSGRLESVYRALLEEHINRSLHSDRPPDADNFSHEEGDE